jgi:hypothetical protein
VVVLPWPGAFVASSQMRLADPLTPCLKQDDPGVSRRSSTERRTRMSEQPGHWTFTPEDEASEAGATSEGFGNLSVEDDAKGTVNPADLARTGDPDDDAVDS